MMEVWEIQGVTLEYDDDTHTYLADGVILPSVTQILSLKFKDQYKGVNEDVLARAAERGTQIHKAIELYCKGEDLELPEVRGFKFLQKNYDISVLANEVPILLFEKGKPIIAGRTDMLAHIEGKFTLADIKTTSVLNRNYLMYQLNLYRVGFEQSYNMDIERLAGIHLRRDVRKLVDIPIDDLAVKELLEMRGKE